MFTIQLANCGEVKHKQRHLLLEGDLASFCDTHFVQGTPTIYMSFNTNHLTLQTYIIYCIKAVAAIQEFID